MLRSPVLCWSDFLGDFASWVEALEVLGLPTHDGNHAKHGQHHTHLCLLFCVWSDFHVGKTYYPSQNDPASANRYAWLSHAPCRARIHLACFLCSFVAKNNIASILRSDRPFMKVT